MATIWSLFISFIWFIPINHAFDIPLSCYDRVFINSTKCCIILRNECKFSQATIFNCSAVAGSNLTYLAMRGCALTGSIPAELTILSYLQHLDLSRNVITGTIPSTIGEIGNMGEGLQHINLSNNSLSGSIPKSIGDEALQSTLLYLDISSNKLTRMNLPAIASLSAIQHLDLSKNRITENFHEKLGQFPHLQVLNLGNNRLSSSIPNSVASMDKLTILNLEKNEMTGTLPANLSNINTLKVVNISHNKFTGNVPIEWENWKHSLLNNLNLGNNSFDCPVQDYSTFAKQSDFISSYGNDGNARCVKEPSDKKGISGGVAAVIVIVVLVAVGAALYWFYRIKTGSQKSHVKHMLYDEDVFDD